MTTSQEVLDSSEFWCITHGEALDVLRELPDNSIDSLVCDPPAGIEFMGKEWDSSKGGWEQWIESMSIVMEEVLRVLKPGAHGLVWAIPRTSHWTGMALEIAGFEIRDRLAHIFGQGFPKSLNVGKEVEDWNGWGTALKPAVEDWWLVRKPVSGTVAESVLENGTGALNIDGCRVGTTDTLSRVNSERENTGYAGGPWKSGTFGTGDSSGGRWPANLLLSHVEECLEKCAEGCPIKTLDEQSGSVGQLGPQLTGDEPSEAETGAVTGKRKRVAQAQKHNDKGGASRFFTCFKYEPKASRSEREYGCENLPSPNPDDADARRNTHPTVKPVELMRWLCRLITPPGGVVLDPFAGSGTTGIAALKEGFRFIGIDKDAHYCEIAIARLAATWSDLISD